MSFLRHGEIYHFDEGAIPQDHALAHHRNDEFPAGYSSAGCSPAGPASASPADASILWFSFKTKTFAANGKLSLVTLSQPGGSLQFGMMLLPIGYRGRIVSLEPVRANLAALEKVAAAAKHWRVFPYFQAYGFEVVDFITVTRDINQRGVIEMDCVMVGKLE
jgi:hypothetical protein